MPRSRIFFGNVTAGAAPQIITVPVITATASSVTPAVDLEDFWYTTGLKECFDGTISLGSDTLKVMLVSSSYVPNKDNTVVDAGGANDPIDHEISVSGYANGWGGAGRKSFGTVSFVANNTDDAVDIGVATDLTWTALGAGATIAGAVLIKEGVSDDTTSRLIAYWPITPAVTNGGDFILDLTPAASGGNLRVA